MAKRKLVKIAGVVLCIIVLMTQIAFAGADGEDYVISLKVARETLNGYSYQVKTDSSVKLSWEAIPGADSYRLERINSKNKVLDAWNISGSETQYTVTGIKPNTSYYFRISAQNGNAVLAKSKRLKVTTFSTTTGYFYDQVVVKKEWPGILLTKERAGDSAIYSFNNVEGNMPAIKYNYASQEKKLYINAFVKYIGKGQNEMFEYYKYSDKTCRYEPWGTADVSYKELITSGIKDCWSFDVKGTSYDFKPGVSFATEVNLIDKDLPKQNYVTIYIGDKGRTHIESDDYWFYAAGCCVTPSRGKPAEYNYRSEYFPLRIVMPTQAQLAANRNKEYGPNDDGRRYARTAAHEFGHILGVGDAYSSPERGQCVRTVETGGYNTLGRLTRGLMASEEVTHASANDLEMALTAQGMAIRREPCSWQAFVDYSDDTTVYTKSKAIRAA